jgi:hypothetical protein
MRPIGRNDTDGTRNADKPFSEFHISPHLAGFMPGHGFMVIVTQGNRVAEVPQDMLAVVTLQINRGDSS